ncbi:MAG: hypothetical protein AMJ69_05425 [Gammaproteobacteria bacterium SG8_47]|nr:MAG: hypothetical protein AMJ69_05425 [Gammaproteobacteria bacterium SG8_47]
MRQSSRIVSELLRNPRVMYLAIPPRGRAASVACRPGFARDVQQGVGQRGHGGGDQRGGSSRAVIRGHHRRSRGRAVVT